MGVVFSKRAEVKNILEDVSREMQEGTQGQWQQESNSQRFWSKSEETWIWDGALKSCGRAVSHKGWQLGRVHRRMRRKKRNRQNGLSRKHAKLVRKWRKRKLYVWAKCREILRKKYGLPEEDDCASRWKGRSHLVVCPEFKERYREEEKSSEWTLRRWQRMKLDVWTFGHCTGNSEEEHGLLAAGHCACRRNGRRNIVVCLPALQQFSFGTLHLVGISGTWRRQQQKEEALQLVVCGVWGQQRMESAEQDTSCAARYQCQCSKGVQSARDAARAM